MKYSHWLWLTAACLSLLLTGCKGAEESERAQPTANRESEFFCPMHPRVVGVKAGEKCPICAMPLSKRKRGEGEALIQAARANLKPEEQRLVSAQDFCPIREGNRLGLVGMPPFKLVLNGQPVFLCCDDCEKAARADPDGTLAKVEKLKVNRK